MADFLTFNEGAQYLVTAGHGLPSTCYFALSTKTVNTFNKTDTLSGTGIGEITGTGYTRLSQSAPTPSGQTTTFVLSAFSTSTASDWPANVASVVLTSTSDNTGKAICAWNLQAGGAVRDMGHANTTETVTPSITTTS